MNKWNFEKIINLYSNDYGETWNETSIPQPLQYSPKVTINEFMNKVETSEKISSTKIVQKSQGAVERNEDLITGSAHVNH